jgi:hypothetical protein
MVILIATSLLEGLKRDTKYTCSITRLEEIFSNPFKIMLNVYKHLKDTLNLV